MEYRTLSNGAKMPMEEFMQAFFDIMQDRDRTPEQQADILMNGMDDS